MKNSKAENDQFLSFSDEVNSVFIDAIRHISVRQSASKAVSM